jgi:hypothetical protein
MIKRTSFLPGVAFLIWSCLSAAGCDTEVCEFEETCPFIDGDLLSCRLERNGSPRSWFYRADSQTFVCGGLAVNDCVDAQRRARAYCSGTVWSGDAGTPCLQRSMCARARTLNTHRPECPVVRGSTAFVVSNGCDDAIVCRYRSTTGSRSGFGGEVEAAVAYGAVEVPPRSEANDWSCGLFTGVDAVECFAAGSVPSTSCDYCFGAVCD